MRSLICGFLIFLSSTISFGQFVTVQDGDWDDPATWGDVTFPTSGNSTSIVVDHVVTVTNNLNIDQTTVNGSILVNDGVILTIDDGTGIDLTMNGSIVVKGTLALANSATHSGMTASTASFEANSSYRHLFTTSEGVIPLATWDPASTVEILGYTTFNAATAGGNWDQNFGNFTWNCTGQTSTLNLNGLFAPVSNGGIEGDLRVSSTGTGVIQLSNGQSTSMDIADSVLIAGTSRVHFTVTGIVTLDIGGSFVFTSTSATGSELVDNTGSCTINLLSGDFIMNAPGGDLDCSDNANGTGTINIAGNFDLTAGTLTETGGGTAQGNINFTGTSASHTFTNNGTINNLINYNIPASNTVVVIGESRMRGVGGTLTLDGILRVESTAPNGAIQTGNTNTAGTGNIRTTTRVYNAGSEVVYGGSAAQVIGNGQPATADVTTTIDNAAGVSLNNTSAATVTMGGDLIVLTGDLTVSNDGLTVDGNIDLQGGNINFTTVGTARTITANGDFILSGGDLISTSGTANASLIINGDISGGNFMSFSGANSNLTINGTGALSVDFPINSATTFENITINRTAGGSVVFPSDLNVTTLFTLTSGDLTVNGNLTVTTLNMNGGDVTMNGDLTATDITATSGNIIMFGSLLLTDDLNMATGTTLFFEGQTVELRSQFNNNLTGGVFFADGSSTLNITNTGALGTLVFDPSGNTLASFTLSRPTGGTLVTLNSVLTVDNTFDLTDGIFLNTSGLNFGSGAIVTRNSAASFAAGSAVPTGGPYDLILNGAGMTTGVETQGNLSDVTSNSTGTVTLAAGFPMTASGNIQINSGTFACGANDVATSTLTNLSTFTAPSTTLTLTGDLTNSGTFNRNNGTVSFDGTSAILGTTNPSFQNIIINGTLSPPATLNLHGSFTNNGTFNNSGTGTVAFLGTAAITQVVSGSSVTDFNNITVTNTTANPDVSINTNQNLTGVLTLAATAIFDADGAGAAVFTLISSNDDPTADAGIATLPGSAQVTGDVTVQRFMVLEGSLSSNQIWRNISSPVNLATVADLQNELPISGTFTGHGTSGLVNPIIDNLTNPSLFIYDETVTTDTDGSGIPDLNDGFTAFPFTTNSEFLSQTTPTSTRGRGYSVFIFGAYEPLLSQTDAKWDLRGNINSGNINLPVTFTSTGDIDNDGWNLVGNPYPSAINWNLLSRTNVDNAIYFEDYSTGDYVIASFVNGVGTNGGTNILATGQGFWVKANAGSPVLSITESAKVAGTSTTFFRMGQEQPEILRIALIRGDDRDETVIRIHPEATDGFDTEWDAWKMKNPYWYINVSSTIPTAQKDLSINTIKLDACAETVKLYVTAINGTYNFEFSDFHSIASDVELTLVDNFTGVRTDIRQSSSYSFSVDEQNSVTYEDRFVVELSLDTEGTSLSLLSGSTCVITDAAVEIEYSSPDYNYSIFSADGLTEILSNFSGDGNTKRIVIPEAFVGSGLNQYLVRATHKDCDAIQTEAITELMYLAKPDSPQTLGAQACSVGSTVVLEASGATPEESYKWYNESGNEINNNGLSQLEVVVESASIFYVSKLNSIGCEGDRVEVKTSVMQEAAISIVDTYTLKSNYASGNQWYLNGVKLEGQTSPTLVVVETGTYSLEVNVNDCIKTAEVQFIITDAEDVLTDVDFQIYPNPVKDKLSVEIKSNSSVEGAIFTSKGQLVSKLNFTNTEGNAWTSTYEMSQSPHTLYFLQVVTGSTVKVFKILKD